MYHATERTCPCPLHRSPIIPPDPRTSNMDVQTATRDLTAVQLAEALLSRLKERKHDLSIDSLEKIEGLLGSATSVVRISLNASRLINRIPPEILGLIFKHVPSRLIDAESARIQFMWPRAAVKATRELFTVMNICSHWREVALAQPSLWTSVDDNRRIPEQFTQDCLKRSKILPLMIYVDRLPARCVAELLGSVSEWSRIEELHLVNFAHDDASPGGVQTYMEFAASRLEYLSLSTTQQSLGDPAVPAVTPSSPVLFSGEAPRLRWLTMQSLHWLPGNTFQSLTHLCICHRRTPQEFVPSWGLPDLLALVGRCPNIEELVVAGVEPTLDHAALAECIPQAVGSLQRISVGNVSPGIAAWCLNYLSNPAGLGIRIFDMVCGNRGLLPMLARAAPVHHPVKIGMGMVRDTLNFIAASETSGVRIESEVNEDGRMCSDCTGWIASWWTIWSMNSIKQVWFKAPFDMRMYADHGRLFSMLMSLDTVFIGECPGFAFEDTLRPWFQILLTHAPNMLTIPCPALATLYIWIGNSSVAPDIITNFVATRAQLGHPIKHLRIGCHEESPFDKSFDWSIVQPHVDSVEFRVSTMIPSMELPPSCVTKPHDYWPVW